MKLTESMDLSDTGAVLQAVNAAKGEDLTLANLAAKIMENKPSRPLDPVWVKWATQLIEKLKDLKWRYAEGPTKRGRAEMGIVNSTGCTSVSVSGAHDRSRRPPAGSRTTTIACAPLLGAPISCRAAPAVVPAGTRTAAGTADSGCDDTDGLLGRWSGRGGMLTFALDRIRDAQSPRVVVPAGFEPATPRV